MNLQAQREFTKSKYKKKRFGQTWFRNWYTTSISKILRCYFIYIVKNAGK